jgi:hypothetical protein
LLIPCCCPLNSRLWAEGFGCFGEMRCGLEEVCVWRWQTVLSCKYDFAQSDPRCAIQLVKGQISHEPPSRFSRLEDSRFPSSPARVHGAYYVTKAESPSVPNVSLSRFGALRSVRSGLYVITNSPRALLPLVRLSWVYHV